MVSLSYRPARLRRDANRLAIGLEKGRFCDAQRGQWNQPFSASHNSVSNPNTRRRVGPRGLLSGADQAARPQSRRKSQISVSRNRLRIRLWQMGPAV